VAVVTDQNGTDPARLALAWQLLADLVRIDTLRSHAKKHMSLAVAASGTTLTEVYGVGPFVACAVDLFAIDGLEAGNGSSADESFGSAPGCGAIRTLPQ
jgi:hypothetical protein